jgi:hypothetical protein
VPAPRSGRAGRRGAPRRNADGSPQVSAVRIGRDGDDVGIAHPGEHEKVRARDRTRGSRPLAGPDADPAGMQDGPVVHGTVPGAGAPGLLRAEGCAAGGFGGEPPAAHVHRPGIGFPLNTNFCASATGS